MSDGQMYYVDVEGGASNRVRCLLYGGRAKGPADRRQRLEQGWRDTKAEAWEVVAAKFDEVAASCREQARLARPEH